ncbi:MAG TPA: hypothetical protein VIL25_01535 [Vicinamibacterales bacterium]
MPISEYRARLQARQAAVQRLERRHDRFATSRLGIAGAGALIAWMSVGPDWISPLWLAAPVLAFVVVALLHDRVLRSLDEARRAVAFYERGIARLEDRWVGVGPTGERHLDASHPYAADLDLFGRGSLFQLICTARLQAGEATLARWLLGPAPIDVIRERQQAIAELRPLLDLRERLALTGEAVSGLLHADTLAAWGTQPSLLEGRLPRITAALLAFANVATLTGGFWFGLPGWPAVLSLAASISFSLWWRRPVSHVLAAVNAPAGELRLLAQVLALVETTPLRSPALASLHARLAAAGDTASHRIAELTRLVDLLDARRNQVFAPVAALLLWGTQLAFAVEAWRRRSGRSLGEWVAVAGEFEALMSLAGYAYERPDDPFPELLESGAEAPPPPGCSREPESGAEAPPLQGSPRVEAPLQGFSRPACFDGEGLAHPLLPVARAVPNDVRLDASTRVLVVSGSNMSGKSTLLRTVGINAVLALCGAPVRARRLTLTPLAIGATLRIQDSLQEGRSRFFAEITRLKQIVDLAAGPLPVLFLLDELLSGTNSHDRRTGAAGIIRGLIRRGAIGLVTTHDLALAEMADDLGVHAVNVHFSDVFEEGEIRFDYRLRPGIVRTSNAVALMRSVGLDVEIAGNGAGTDDTANAEGSVGSDDRFR